MILIFLEDFRNRKCSKVSLELKWYVRIEGERTATLLGPMMNIPKIFCLSFKILGMCPTPFTFLDVVLF